MYTYDKPGPSMRSSPGNGVPSVGEQDAKRTADLGRGAREDDLVLEKNEGMKRG